MPAGPTITNSSCLIALEAVSRLDLLEQLYGTVVVPAAVANECGFAHLPKWVQVKTVQNSTLVQALRSQLGAGESEAIAWRSSSPPRGSFLMIKRPEGLLGGSLCPYLERWR
jgi:predicted nucleic acid-binding protein